MKKPPHFAGAFQNFRCNLFRGASEEFLVLKCLSIVYALEGGRSSKHGYVYVGVSLSSPRQFGLKSYISLVIHLRSPSQILNYNLLDHWSSQNLVKVDTKLVFNIVEMYERWELNPRPWLYKNHCRNQRSTRSLGTPLACYEVFYTN